jgi:hypothetical protein
MFRCRTFRDPSVVVALLSGWVGALEESQKVGDQVVRSTTLTLEAWQAPCECLCDASYNEFQC